MSSDSLEIVCSACGADTLVRREPVYEGFTRKGERFVCVSCGHAYPDRAAVPFKARKAPSLFTEADRIARPQVFAADEKGRTCRHCRHYVINPFTQRCGLHNRTVEATDTCGDFTPRAPGSASSDGTPKTS